MKLILALISFLSVQGDQIPPWVPDGLGLGFTVHIYAPEGTGSFPTIFFVSGGSGLAPVAGYNNLIQQVVAQGFIFVGLDHLAFPSYKKQGKAFHNVLEWAKDGNLTAVMKKRGLSAVPDLDKVAVMGQSAGNHVVGEGIKQGCSLAKALVLLDPVDGFDPFGILKGQNLIQDGEKVTFNIPTLHLDNALDPVSLHPGTIWPSCSPWNLSGPHWYNAMLGPVWNINATAYGHVDCITPVVPGICPTDPSTDKKAYVSMLADATTTFLGVLFGTRPAEDLSLLETSSHFSVDVTLKHDLKGLTHDQVQPGCTNVGVVV